MTMRHFIRERKQLVSIRTPTPDARLLIAKTRSTNLGRVIPEVIKVIEVITVTMVVFRLLVITWKTYHYLSLPPIACDFLKLLIIDYNSL